MERDFICKHQAMTDACAKESIRSIRRGFGRDKLLLLANMSLSDDRNQYALRVLRKLLDTLEYAGDIVTIVLHANWNMAEYLYECSMEKVGILDKYYWMNKNFCNQEKIERILNEIDSELSCIITDNEVMQIAYGTVLDFLYEDYFMEYGDSADALPFPYFSLSRDREMAEMGLEYLQKALDLIRKHKEVFGEGINLLELIKKYPDF